MKARTAHRGERSVQRSMSPSTAKVGATSGGRATKLQQSYNAINLYQCTEENRGK